MSAISIGLPTSPYLRYFLISFAHLVEFNKAQVYLDGDSLQIRSTHADVRTILAGAYQYSIQLLQEYVNRWGRDLPYTGNDKTGPLRKLYGQLRVSQGQPISQVVKAYVKRLRRTSVQKLQSALQSFSTNGDIALISALNLEFYGYSRAPFFDGEHKPQLRLNIDQTLMCLAGYFAARVTRSRLADEWLTVLALPNTLGFVKYDIYRNWRSSLDELPGLRPEQAVLLWTAIHLPRDFPDLMLVGVRDPGGQKPCSVGASLAVSLGTFRARGERFMALMRDQVTKELTISLLKSAFAKGRKSKQDVDDAAEYVRLLYLAAQGFERERNELVLRASRIESRTSLSKDPTEKARHRVASYARRVGMALMK